MRSNARPSVRPAWEVLLDAGRSFLGRYRLGPYVERARALDDRGPRVLLWRPGAPQERTQHDDDEHRRARRDRRPVDVGGVFDRVQSGQLVAWWPLMAWPAQRRARAQSDVFGDDSAAGPRDVPGDVRDHHPRP